MSKPLCKACGKRGRAVNYVKDQITHYRSLCMACLRKQRKAKPGVLAWLAAGYRKKLKCERCGFRAVIDEQLFVYYLDGDGRNNLPSNLITICACCSILADRRGLGWKPSSIEPDV
jgi:hypothetical protein